MYLYLQKCISVKSYTDDFRLVYKLGCAPSTVKPKIKKFYFLSYGTCITEYNNITKTRYDFFNRFAVEQTVAVLIYVTTTRAKNEARKKGTQRHKV